MDNRPPEGAGVESIGPELAALGLSLPFEQAVQLERYVSELERWGRSMNLTSLSGAALARKLVAEPLWVLREIERVAGSSVGRRYLDIGSGNGSPALPWCVAGGFGGVELVEARGRRATFLRQAARGLGLPGLRVHRGRFKDVLPDLAPPDRITLQGVRLTRELRDQIVRIAAQGALIVWFTSGDVDEITPSLSLELPASNHRALVFEV